jgi:hypothetical protein
MEEAKAYLEDEIERVLPTIDDVCDGMSVTLVIKDVTWETVNNVEFVEWLKHQYKNAKELNEPFETYTAARGRTVAPAIKVAAQSKGAYSGGCRCCCTVARSSPANGPAEEPYINHLLEVAMPEKIPIW